MSTAAKATRAVKDAADQVETFTIAGQHQMKEGVERSMAAMAEVGAFGKENVEAMVASATVATKGFEAVSARAVAYSKSAMEAHMAAAKSVMASKSVQEVMEKQAEYARSAFDTYVAEMGKMTELLSGVTKDAAKPINERVSAVSHLIQNSTAR